MTWVSERSGMASSGMFWMQWTAPAMAAAVRMMTMYLFLAENSMIFSIMFYFSPAAALVIRFRAALRLDSESTRKLADVTTFSPSLNPPRTS